MLPWSVPPLWEGETAFIVGGGPSLASVDLESLRGRKVIAINSAILDAPFAEVAIWSDPRAYRLIGDFLKTYSGHAVTTDRDSARGSLAHYLIPSRRPELALDPIKLSGRNTGQRAINLAFHLGSRKHVLLGFDMRKVNGRDNYHDRYNVPKSPKVLERDIRDMEVLARDARRLGLEILNASEGSALTCFPMVRLERVLENAASVLHRPGVE